MCRKKPTPRWAIGPKKQGSACGKRHALFLFAVMTEGLGMVVQKRFLASLAITGAFATAALAPAHAADPVADFYKGKTVQVLVGFGPGGGYDLYARTLARYMGRHVPGNPTMVPQNMPG